MMGVFESYPLTRPGHRKPPPDDWPACFFGVLLPCVFSEFIGDLPVPSIDDRTMLTLTTYWDIRTTQFLCHQLPALPTN